MIQHLKNIFNNFYYCFMDDASLESDLQEMKVDHESIDNANVSDDWERVDPEVIQKRLQERKKVEESDHQLTNELFNETYVIPNSEKTVSVRTKQPSKKNDKLKIDIVTINKSYIKNDEAKKNAKKKWERRKEVFGEAECDEIYTMSYDIEEKHGKNA